jgi:hypothetical protein
MKTFAIVLLLLLSTARADATVFLPGDLGDLSRDAYAIARGRIVSVEARWTTPARRSIETIVTMETGAWLKRDLGGILQFRVPGGRLGRYRNVVIGAPALAPGQQVIVFLGAAPPALPYILGMSQGVFRLAPGAGGWVVTPPAVMPTTGPPVKVVRGDPARRSLPLADFERRVRALAAGSK